MSRWLMTLFNGVFTLSIRLTTQTHYARNFELLRVQYLESLSRISSQMFKSVFKWLPVWRLVYRAGERGVMIGLKVLNIQGRLQGSNYMDLLKNN